MISCENWKDGFMMTIEGMRILRHSSSSPAIFLSVHQETKAKETWRGLGAPHVINEGPELTVLDFSPDCIIRLFYHERVLHMRPSVSGEKAGAFRICFGAHPEEMVFGLGPSTGYDLKKTKLSLSAGAEDTALRREPTAMSSRGTWIHVDGGGEPDWNFRSTITEISCPIAPREIALGFGKTQAAAMELLTRHKAGKRERLPDWLQEWPLIGEGPGGIRQEIPGDGEKSRLIGSEEWEKILSASSARILPCPALEPKRPSAFVSMLLSLSFSGYGHILMPDALELGAFSPLFISNALPEGREKSQAGRVAASAAIYAMLKSYRDYCSVEWVEKGMPVLAHPSLLYPGETRLLELRDQYMFGPDVIIAPSQDASLQQRRLYLPDDEWIHLWTSRHYRGGSTTIHAPEGKPAIFYRRQSAFASLFDALRLKATRL